jgi:thiosulfate/3-mercaptopyruvate sulfurtransferase
MRSRWLGTDPEPRPNLLSGHVPHSFSVPFGNLLKTVEDGQTNSKYTVFRSKEEIEGELGDVLGSEFLAQAKRGERSIITSCGSGMTAGVLWLGLQLLGVSKVGLYDEVSGDPTSATLFKLILIQSWTGYASRENSTIQRAT